MAQTDKGAIFSEDKNNRYQLWRIWDDKKPRILFIGLNPSTAGCEEDDKTIMKLTKYVAGTKDVKGWCNEKYGGFYIGNLFPLITAKTKELKNALKTGILTEAIYKENDKHLEQMASKCEKIIAIWGNYGYLKGRDATITEMFPKMYCLRKNKGGQPAHPLYLPLSLKPIDYR